MKEYFIIIHLKKTNQELDDNYNPESNVFFSLSLSRRYPTRLPSSSASPPPTHSPSFSPSSPQYSFLLLLLLFLFVYFTPTLLPYPHPHRLSSRYPVVSPSSSLSHPPPFLNALLSSPLSPFPPQLLLRRRVLIIIIFQCQCG